MMTTPPRTFSLRIALLALCACAFAAFAAALPATFDPTNSNRFPGAGGAASVHPSLVTASVVCVVCWTSTGWRPAVAIHCSVCVAVVKLLVVTAMSTVMWPGALAMVTDGIPDVPDAAMAARAHSA